MSRNTAPPPTHPTTTTATSATMTETQTVPSLPPPPFLDYDNRRLPQPIQLPPLAIPRGSPRTESQIGTSQPGASQPQPLPTVHAASYAQPLRSQPRSYSGPAAPLDKLLSPHPYTPPRSESAYSPQRSPPRSITEARPHSRQPSETYPVLEPPRQTSRTEPPYASPVDTHRSSYGSAPSPSAGYNPAYPPPYTAHSSGYRQAPPQVHGVGYGPPPPAFGEPPHHPPRYGTVPTNYPPQYVPDPNDLQYILKVRQQPIAARACGFGERDRRVIDPPPIIQLEVRDPKNGVVDLDELRYSLNVVHCTLWNAAGTSEETALIQPDRRTTRRLMGQLVASPSVAKDEHDVEGCFFCFPDLSCRTHGKYRLRFVLMQIDPMNLHVGGFSPILTEVLSDVFQVYTAKDFPGMRPSSALTRALKLQGCNIQVKKGNDKALARKRHSLSSEEGRAAASVGGVEADAQKKRKKKE